MSTAINYTVALDKNGDGFVNVYATPADPPNRVPTPVTFLALPIAVAGMDFPAFRHEDLPYGTTALAFKASSAAAAVYLGANFPPPVGSVAAIPVTPGQPHTAACWLRGVWNYAGIPLTWRVFDPAWNPLAFATLTLTDTWTQVSVTFTPPAGVTHVCLALEKAAGASTFLDFDLAGPLLVQASAAPTAFNAGDDLNDAITPDVLEMTWRLGLAAPYDSTAAPTSGTLLLYNLDRRASPVPLPAPGDLPLVPGRRVRILAARAGEVTTLFHGIIDHVAPEAGSEGGRTCVVHLAGMEQFLSHERVVLPVLTQVRSDQVVKLIIERAAPVPVSTALEPGDRTLNYVADTWQDGVIAITPVRQVTDVEGGRFFTDRRGTLTYLRGGHLKGRVTPAALFNEQYDALTYLYGADMVNQVRVPVRPRAVGSAGADVWRLAQSQRIRPGPANSRTMQARLRDSSGQPIGALTVIAPAPYVDYLANTQPDGSGSDVTGFVSLALASEVSGSAITLAVTSAYSGDVHLLAGARLRGTPLYLGDPLVVERTDTAARKAYGVRGLTLDMPLLTSVDEADALARDLLRRRKNPFGAARELSLSATLDAPQVLARTLFDRITIKDAQLRHESDYFIVAEAHTVDLGGARHRVTWTLEPANPGDGWQLGRSPLGQVTRLGVRY